MAEDDQLIAGRYRLVARVGSGAMGVVWRAEDELLGRLVALKQVRLPGGVDDETRDLAYRRVMREGRLFARLHHAHAIAVFDVVDHDAQPWLVMEYLPSQSLSEAVAAHGVLSPAAAARVGHQIAAALTAAHEAGIVHRDVKPGNVLLGPDGVVKVTDFGVSRAIDEPTITSNGMIAGTPAFLAPEVARGADADFRSDVYSLGSTIYAAVEGRPPFGLDENALAQLHHVATGDYSPPQRAGSLTSLLERLLADDPARRPEMHQVRDELGRLAAVEVETDVWIEEGLERSSMTLPELEARRTGPRGKPARVRLSAVERSAHAVADIGIGSGSGSGSGSGTLDPKHPDPYPGEGTERWGGGTGAPDVAGTPGRGSGPRCLPAAGAPLGPAGGTARPAVVAVPDQDGPPRESALPRRVAVTATPPAPVTRPQPANPPTVAPAARGDSDTVASPLEKHDDEGGVKGRRGRVLAVGLAVLLVVAVAAIAFVMVMTPGDNGASLVSGPVPTAASGGVDADRSASGSGPAQGSGSRQGSVTGSASGTAGGAVAPAPGTSEQVAQQQAVIDYYAMIPTNLTQGWQRLTPRYQRNTAGGFGGYTRFWAAIDQVTVRGVSPSPTNSVDATVTYVFQDGRSTEERTLFTMVQQDGVWKIDGSQVLSSR